MDKIDTQVSSATSPRCLRITEAQFNELYPDLVGHYNFFNEPPPHDLTEAEFETRYLTNKLWRLNNLYYVTNKHGDPVLFRMSLAQHRVYAAARQHPRLIILKSRQQGISTLWLVVFFDDAIACPYLNIGLMAQGTDEASTLLERVKFLWDCLHPQVKSFLNLKVTKDNIKEYSFSNNSSIFIRVSFRSATLQRLHISEFGKIANATPQRAKETKTGTLQALAPGNTGIIESTAEGRNDFKTMWDAAVLAESTGQLAPKDFKPVFLSWLEDPDCTSDIKQADTKESVAYFTRLQQDYSLAATQEQKNFWIIQYRELGGDIYQEYPATPEEAFAASRDGTYWSQLYLIHVVRQGRVQSNLWDPNLPTDVYFDLGVDDYMVMGFVQWYRGSYRIVGEYWNNGYSLTHYIDEAEARGFNIRDYVFPHDINVRELTNKVGGLARTRLDVVREYFRDNNIKANTRVLDKSGVADGIEAVRRMIPNLWIDSACAYLQDCFMEYSKEWDQKLKVWKKTPLHDEYSHGADVLRSIAIGVVENSSRNTATTGISRRQRNSSYDV